MKRAILAGVLVLGLSLGWGTAAPLMESVPVKLGPKAFRDGDVIQILEVESTSPKLEQGDSVVVRGRYRLDSEESAMLSLCLTHSEGNGIEEADATQTLPAAAGWHEFELSILIMRRGILHLTFHGQEEGRPFGGVYFGTVEQMARADHGLVAHYDVGAVVFAADEKPEKSEEPVKAVKLKYDYGFSSEVESLMRSVEQSDPNQARHPRVKGEVLLEKVEEEAREEIPPGDFHQVWPPKEFRLENRKPEGTPADPAKMELPSRRLPETPRK